MIPTLAQMILDLEENGWKTVTLEYGWRIIGRPRDGKYFLDMEQLQEDDSFSGNFNCECKTIEECYTEAWIRLNRSPNGD